MKKIVLLLNLHICFFAYNQLEDGFYRFYNDSLSLTVSIPSIKPNAPGWSADIEVYNRKSKKSYKSSLEYAEQNDVQWYQSINNADKKWIELSFVNDFQIELMISENKKTKNVVLRQPALNLEGVYYNKMKDKLIIEPRGNGIFHYLIDTENNDACGLIIKGAFKVHFSQLKYKYYDAVLPSISKMDDINSGKTDEESSETETKFELKKEGIKVEPDYLYVGMECLRMFDVVFKR
jgi:hypothetical protein